MDNKSVKFNSNFSFELGAVNRNRVYGFSYQNFENASLKKQLFYEIEMAFRDTTLAGNYIFEINRKTIYIDNKASYSKIEQIAETAAQTIFPLLIKTKKNGLIDDIVNHDSIIDRWLETRKSLLQYYKGEKALKALVKIETLLLDKIALKKSLNQIWFFHLFFKPLYIDYTEKFSINDTWKSPIFGNQLIEYGVVQTLQENYSDDEKIIININGTSIDERTIDEILSGFTFSKSKFSETESVPVESKMDVNYKLYKEDRSIFSITASFESKIDDKKHEIIQVEIYHLTESSSYRPQSDEIAKANQKIWESWQTAEDEDIIDFSKPKWQTQAPPAPKVPKEPHEKIELYVGEGPPDNLNQSLWTRMKSIFKKNK